MKKYKTMYYSGAVISLLVGLWHFTVPWIGLLGTIHEKKCNFKQ